MGLGGKVLFGTVVVLDGAIGVASKCTVGGQRGVNERKKGGRVRGTRRGRRGQRER